MNYWYLSKIQGLNIASPKKIGLLPRRVTLILPLKYLTKISNGIKYWKENNFSDKIYEYFNSIENNSISCK